MSSQEWLVITYDKELEGFHFELDFTPVGEQVNELNFHLGYEEAEILLSKLKQAFEVLGGEK